MPDNSGALTRSGSELVIIKSNEIENLKPHKNITRTSNQEDNDYLNYIADGRDFTFENILSQAPLYTRYQISYISEGRSISGIMNIPKNIENAPLIILNHGYIDTSIYTLGRGLKREQDYFASNGFAVIHSDYRNHGFSDTDQSLSSTGMILRIKKYGTDVINAILAVQKSQEDGEEILATIDTQSIGMLGHSMGGGVTMYSLVAAPELIDAAILYAPVHSNEYYNYQRWSSSRLNSREKEKLTNDIGNLQNPDTFASISPQGYFKNVQAPVQIYFGSQDESCPVSWGKEIKESFNNVDKQVDLVIYEGERHEFVPQWTEFMEGSTAFFKKNLNNKKDGK
ncbi:alpha/beta fold hydrolase [Candidatus Gracilibacteria bacterium]|nr:alpha/beta fold hydrolase [Candidatus Gracilibacteria bacterium]